MLRCRFYSSIGRESASLRHCVLLFLVCAAFLGTQQAYCVIFYVAPEGQDAWSGTLTGPNADKTDGPLASLPGARDAVRALKAKGPLTEPVTVVIADGMYALDETFVLGPEDSGTEVCPITYVAADGAHPVISGGRRIPSWCEGEGGVWQTHIPEVENSDWYFHQLFVNGRRATRARTPNEGYLRTDGPIEPLGDRGEARRDTAKKLGFRFVPGDIQPWEGLGEVNVWTYHSWTASLHWIKEIDEAEHILHFRGPSNWPMGYWEAKQRYHIENHRAALDAPGEWYLDPATGTLYYRPLPGEDMAQAEVIAPKLGVLLEVKGDLEQGGPVAFVTFKGLAFQHADWIVDKDVGNDGQGAAFQKDAAITLWAARHVTFEQCEVAHVGTYAMWFRAGSKHDRLVQCHIHDLGTGGLRIGETGEAPDEEQATGHVLVENCWIHDGGHVFPAGHGVWMGKTSYNTVRHCDISDFYYTGIAIGSSWGYAPSTANHNVVEFCHIHNLGKGVLSDMGAIYTLGDSPGTRLTNNVMHDVFSYSYGGWGLYNDEGSTGIVMENNVVYNTKTGGYHQHYGKENVLRNNIFAFSKEGQIIRSREEDHISFFFERNIVLVDNGNALGHNWKNGQYRLDHNLYWDVAGLELEFAKWTFGEWKEKGNDAHSIVADPLFLHAAHYDFRLKPASPAYGLGFKDIDTSKAGLYGPPEWAGAPKRVTRAALNLSHQMPRVPSSLDDDFEDTAVGAAPKNAHVSLGGDALVAMSDDTAASGTHSLKFVDAPGLDHEWQPHLSYPLQWRKGQVINTLALRIEPGVRMSMEWRDWRGDPYRVGPNFALTPDGQLTTFAGKPLMAFPANQWVRFEITCDVGARNPGTFDMTVSVPGAEPRVFKDLPMGSTAFRQLTWLGFSSTATEKQVFYIDDLHLQPKG